MGSGRLVWTFISPCSGHLSLFSINGQLCGQKEGDRHDVYFSAELWGRKWETPATYNELIHIDCAHIAGMHGGACTCIQRQTAWV